MSVNHPMSWQAIEAEAIAKVETIRSSGSLQFVFITDTHHAERGNQLQAAQCIQRLAGRIPFDFIALGGDVSVNGEKRNVMELQSEMIDALSVPSCPLLTVKGNHDDNSIYDYYHDPTGTSNVIFPEETFGIALERLNDIVRFEPDNPGGLYYYYDIPDKKTRVIVLNCIDIPYVVSDSGGLKHNGQWKYAFSERQLHWVAGTALDLDGVADRGEWGVLFLSHVALLQDGVFGSDHPIVNAEVMWGIIQAYRNGSSFVSVPTTGDFAQSVAADFSEQGVGRVFASLFGHVHYDQVLVREGIPMISTLNCQTHRDFEEAPAREKETASAIAFDIVTVDAERGIMNMTRVGAGEDRSVKLAF